jgi:hypothetical protein
MRFDKAAGVLVMLMAAWGVFATTINAADHNPNANARRGRNSASMEKRSGTNDNQWQADPQRGWVRSDELRNRKDQRTSTKQSSEKKSKQKDHKWFF